MKPSQVDMNYWLTHFDPTKRWWGSDESSGKWMVTFETMEELDAGYELLRTALFDKHSLGPAFKTSTALDPGKHQPYRFFACCYVESFEEERETLKVLRALRELGFNKELKFKRDRETFAGIYGPNSFYMTAKADTMEVEVHEPHAGQQ